jgi:hypothetical protein
MTDLTDKLDSFFKPAPQAQLVPTQPTLKDRLAKMQKHDKITVIYNHNTYALVKQWGLELEMGFYCQKSRDTIVIECIYHKVDNSKEVERALALEVGEGFITPWNERLELNVRCAGARHKKKFKTAKSRIKMEGWYLRITRIA